MPVVELLEVQPAGPISRKRTHAEITRSSSRSVTPPPSKRRRTTSTTQQRYTPSVTQESAASRIPHSRFVGDGLDFRTPTISVMDQPQEHATIDLTLSSDGDDDSLSVSSSVPTSSQDPRPNHARRRRRRRIRLHNDDFGPQRRAPPFEQPQQQQAREVIDLSGTDAASEGHNRNRGMQPLSLSSSPEVQYVGERVIQRRPILPSVAELAGEPPGLQRADAQTFENRGGLTNAMQRLTNNLLRNFTSGNATPGHPNGRATPYPGWAAFNFLHPDMAMGIPAPLNVEIYSEFGDDDSVFLDYEAGGMGVPDFRDQDVPRASPDYKPPLPAREGFTRTIEDGDLQHVLVCVGCEEMLTSGEGDVKQQVWVLKKCGHVYCGECASQRVSSRGGNSRDRKKAKQSKLDVFKMCQAEGCSEKLTARTAMFQLYL